MVFNDDIKSIDIFLDLENAKPGTDEEKQIYDTVSAILNKGPTILQKLQSYSGCEDSIRKAITSPGQETEEVAWNTVVPAVEQLKEFYDFSIELESCFPKLLVALCKTDPKQNIASQQALAKQMADVFDFVLRFDDLKMVNPAIQNDFSYYRRTLNRKKITKTDVNIVIRDELANRMSLFFAYPTPMMNVINETTTKFLGQDASGVPRENVNMALATMANVCQEMIFQKKFTSETTNMFCLRAMTGSVILFDHLHTTGAFSRRSPIHIKACITALKNYPGPPGSTTEGLLNALRFTTIHLNDPDTPAAVKQLLE
jgi:hypothetical protein